MGRSEMTPLILGHLLLCFSLAFSTSTTAYMALVLGRSPLLEELFESRCKNRGFLITLVTFHCCSSYPDQGLWGVVQEVGTGKSHLHPFLSNSGMYLCSQNWVWHPGSPHLQAVPGSGLHTVPVCQGEGFCQNMPWMCWLPFVCR